MKHCGRLPRLDKANRTTKTTSRPTHVSGVLVNPVWPRHPFGRATLYFPVIPHRKRAHYPLRFRCRCSIVALPQEQPAAPRSAPPLRAPAPLLSGLQLFHQPGCQTNMQANVLFFTSVCPPPPHFQKGFQQTWSRSHRVSHKGIFIKKTKSPEALWSAPVIGSASC